MNVIEIGGGLPTRRYAAKEFPALRHCSLVV
jgi:hypothetical protein